MAPNIHRLLRAGLLIVVFVILLATAYLAGIGNMQTLRKDAYDAGYEAALEAYGLSPTDSLAPGETEEEPLVGIAAVVERLEGSTLIVREILPGTVEPGPERRVVLAEGASIMDIMPKDPAVLARELDAYNRANRANGSATLPAPDIQEEISLAMLVPGDRVGLMTADPDADPIIAASLSRTDKAPPPPEPTPAPAAPTGEPELMTP